MRRTGFAVDVVGRADHAVAGTRVSSAGGALRAQLARAVTGAATIEGLVAAAADHIEAATAARSVVVAHHEAGWLRVRHATGEGSRELREAGPATSIAALEHWAAKALAPSSAEEIAVAAIALGDEVLGAVIAVGVFDDDDRALVDDAASELMLAFAVERVMGSERERVLAASALEVARARETAASDGLRRAIAGQEAERARIARELHDESGQVLTAVALHLRALEKRETDAPYRIKLAELRGAVVEAASSLRQLITELRPPGLRGGGLGEAISDLAERVTPPGPRVDIAVDGLPVDLDEEIEIALYRVVQEALTNASRHADAAHVGITAGLDGARLRIVIEDDGRGFRTDEPTARLGLAGLRERVQLIGGDLHVESAPGAGTSVTVELDLDGL